MQLNLSAEETAVLADVLDRALRNVREEIYKAAVAEYKARLKAREAIITRLLGQVQAPGVT